MKRRPAQAPAEPHVPRVPPAWEPPHWDPPDAAALQALYRGDATAQQQQRALKWIIESAAATYDLPFRPGGTDGSRETDFACGRMFVGQAVRVLLKVNLGAIIKEQSNG